MAISLVLADDHPLILNGLVNLFNLEGDFYTVALCKDGYETIEAVRKHRADVVILDINMPKKDGLEVAREIRKEKLPPRVVLLTAEIDDEQLLESVRQGVSGIVLKEMAPQLLVQCIRKVHAGEQWIERRSSQLALEKVLRREAGARELASHLTPAKSILIIGDGFTF